MVAQVVRSMAASWVAAHPNSPAVLENQRGPMLVPTTTLSPAVHGEWAKERSNETQPEVIMNHG